MLWLQRPLKVTPVCTDVRTGKLLFISHSQPPFLLSFLILPPPLGSLSDCRDVDDISREDPTWLSWADPKLGNKPLLVTSLPLLQRARQSCKLLQEDQTDSTQTCTGVPVLFSREFAKDGGGNDRTQGTRNSKQKTTSQNLFFK